ncbi:GDSL-type esterase/lipase family protein [Amycolatopsis sp. WQ 127309]|uniref:GDSL-type esterase/lipase family protein n=1 Tax=Amycolatopsis sp. WQ 127309 TaxID=2932773 RepID=UPI001FF1B674|nr:GDSL-type esterase/lipase family protein [Amycolatopsis sp. WQ 127309]UOZ04644.1 GDSL-type esterase/lipase family protein [Amycolatopsis sp. WQ 127309]
MRGKVAVLAAVSALAFAAAPVAAGAAQAWFTSWAQSQDGRADTPLNAQSLRMITHLSQGGDAIRVRLQNTFGTGPLSVGHATAGVSAGGAAVTAPRDLTFAGARDVTIPAGGEAWSDELRLTTKPDTNLAVSMSVPGTAVVGRHGAALRDNYLAATGAGDHAGDADGSAFAQTVGSTYVVSAVDVHNTALKGTVVPFGSSVVDGIGSTNCGPGCTQLGADRRWTDDLARRAASSGLAVANAGVSGTTSAPTCPSIPPGVVGLDAASRLDRDVLALHGVKSVIYYYGTNDLAYGCDATAVLDSYRAVFARLRAAGIAIYVTPSTPRPGYSDKNNLDRHEIALFVERWNTCGGLCTGILDFDEVLKDPLKPNSINPAYDNGDGIHANAAGQQALADFISIPMLTAGSTSHTMG